MALRWAVIIVGVTFIQRPLGVLKQARGGVQGGALLLEVCYSSPQGFLWAQQRVYCGPMAYFFTPHTIFLCGEDKHHKCGDGKFIICGSGGIKYRVADTEGYI